MGGCVSTHSRGIRRRGKGRRRSSKHFSKVSDIVPHANIRRPSDVGNRVSFGESYSYVLPNLPVETHFYLDFYL